MKPGFLIRFLFTHYSLLLDTKVTIHWPAATLRVAVVNPGY